MVVVSAAIYGLTVDSNDKDQQGLILVLKLCDGHVEIGFDSQAPLYIDRGDTTRVPIAELTKAFEAIGYELSPRK